MATWQNTSWTPSPGGGGAGPGQHRGPFRGDVASGLDQTISGYFLPGQDGQLPPGLEGIFDILERNERAQWAADNEALNRAASGANMWGGGSYERMAGAALSDYNQRLSDQRNQMLFGAYDSERNRTMEALGIAQQGDIASANRDAASAQAAANASLQRDLQSGQLAFQREALQLEAILAAQSGDLARAQMLVDMANTGTQAQMGSMGLMGDLGLGYGSQQAGMLGMVPGFDQASYYGLMQALGAQGGLDAATNSANAANNAAGWQDQMNQWNWSTQGQQAAFSDWVNSLMGLGSQFGTTNQQGTSPGQYIPTPNPWAAGVGGALQGWGVGNALGSGQSAASGSSSSGGQANPAPGPWGVNP